jgi:pimeloyl-ACP methyl ester carboxylesterase
MPRGDLFPEIGPFETGYLPLSTNHVMYWEQVGNPRGRPVLFLHGGPGAGAGAVHRRFFDPEFWRVVIFDQRGAGRSRPLGSLENNTTQDLVSDIETLRRHLGLDRWLLFGGSWGSTLALAYAQAYPERVIGCVLRGVFLGRPAEVDWFLHGLAAIFPDAHASFASFLPEAERGDVLGGYLRRLTDPDPSVHLPQHPAAEPRNGQFVRAGPHRAGAGPDRGALLRPQPVPAARGAARPHAPHRSAAGRDRTGALRHDLSGAHCVRIGCGLAGGAAVDRAGRWAFGAGAGHPPRAGGRGRALPPREMKP